MRRTLRPQNSLQKKEPFSFDEIPSQERYRRYAGKVPHEEDEGGGTIVSRPNDGKSSELISEERKDQNETRAKRRSRGRPRKTPITNEKADMAKPFPAETECSTVVNSEGTLINISEENFQPVDLNILTGEENQEQDETKLKKRPRGRPRKSPTKYEVVEVTKPFPAGTECSNVSNSRGTLNIISEENFQAVNSNVLTGEENQKQDETKLKKRPRGRPRKSPIKYEIAEGAKPFPAGTECSNISNSEGTLKKVSEEICLPVDLNVFTGEENQEQVETILKKKPRGRPKKRPPGRPRKIPIEYEIAEVANPFPAMNECSNISSSEGTLKNISEENFQPVDLNILTGEEYQEHEETRLKKRPRGRPKKRPPGRPRKNTIEYEIAEVATPFPAGTGCSYISNSEGTLKNISQENFQPVDLNILTGEENQKQDETILKKTPRGRPKEKPRGRPRKIPTNYGISKVADPFPAGTECNVSNSQGTLQNIFEENCEPIDLHVLTSEKNKEQVEARVKKKQQGRPSKRPRGRPRKIPTKFEQAKGLNQSSARTECNNVSTLQNIFEGNCQLWDSNVLTNEENKDKNVTRVNKRSRGMPRKIPTNYEISKVADPFLGWAECHVSNREEDSNVLTSEGSKEQNETRMDKRPRGRPRKRQRGRPRKIPQNYEIAQAADTFPAVTDGSLVGNLKRKNAMEDWLGKCADVIENGSDVAASFKTTSPRKLYTPRKRKRQNEIDDDNFVPKREVTFDRSKRRRKMTPVLQNIEKPSFSDSLSNICKRDHQEFEEVIINAGTEFEQNKIAVCPYCKKSRSKTLLSLLHHIRYRCPKYTKDLVYECKLCNKKCKSDASLEKHMETVHSADDPLLSKSPDQLTREEFSKLLKKQGGNVKCPTAKCEKRFTTLEGVKYHIPRCGMTLQRNLKCEYCGKAYASTPGLNSHILNHHSQTKVVEVSSLPEELAVPSGKRGAAAKAISKLHQIAVDGEIQDLPGGEHEILSEMSSCRLVKKLIRYPTKYKPTATDLASWKLQFETEGRALCIFCKKPYPAVANLKAHINSCRLRPGKKPFYCLSCEAEFKTNLKVLKHLRDFHRELVIATLEQARKDDEVMWEGGDEDEDDEEEEDEDLDLEEEIEDEEVVEEVNLVGTKKKRFRNRFDGTKIDDAYRHVHQQVMKATEWTKQFRSRNYCLKSSALFPDWKVDISKWKSLSENGAAAYHPRTKESVMFATERQKGKLHQKKTEATRLPLYGALPVDKEEDGITFFVGGPIWAVSWCPVPDDAPLAHNYVALSCYLDMDHVQFFDEVEPSPSLIQIWDLGVLKSRTSTTPKMVLGIAHDYGITNGIQWCPSGGYEPFEDLPDSEKPSRLGLLAAACSVGYAVVYSVPHPKTERAICKPDPVVTLKPTRSKEWFGQCLCLDWSLSKGHTKIVAGFGNGTVTMWNLHTKSSLAADEVDGCKHLYPTQVIYACTSLVIAVSINPKDDNFLLVSSVDRSTSMWDVRFPSCPVDEISFSTVLDCHWPLHYQVGMVSTENHSLNSRGCVVHLFDTKQHNSYYTVMALCSSIWSFSISDWLHCTAASADDGKVAINVYTIPDVNYKSSARIKQRIVTDVSMEAKPTQLYDTPSSNQQTISSTDIKQNANNMAENCTQGAESFDQDRKIEATDSGIRDSRESILGQELAEDKVKSHDDVELLSDLGQKSSSKVDQDESFGKTTRKVEIPNESGTSLATSEEGKRDVSQSAGRQLMSRPEAQENDSQHKKENEILPGDETGSFKSSENDLSERELFKEGDGGSLNDSVDGTGNGSVGKRDEVHLDKELPNDEISGDMLECVERNGGKVVEERDKGAESQKFTESTISVTGMAQLTDDGVAIETANVDGMISGDVLGTEDRGRDGSNIVNERDNATESQKVTESTLSVTGTVQLIDEGVTDETVNVDGIISADDIEREDRGKDGSNSAHERDNATDSQKVTESSISATVGVELVDDSVTDETVKVDGMISGDDVEREDKGTDGSNTVDERDNATEREKVTESTLSATVTAQLIDDRVTEADLNLDEIKSDGGIETGHMEDQNLGAGESGVLDLSVSSQGGSCYEVPMTITVKEEDLNSSKPEDESCAMLDESELDNSRIESLDSKINELMTTCHSTLEDLKKCSVLSTESAEPLLDDEEASPKKRLKKKKKEKEAKILKEKKLCIMDEAFDISQVLGDNDLKRDGDVDSEMRVDKDVLRTKVKGWKPKYEGTETAKLVLYKDYYEPVYGSSTWTPLSKKLLTRTLDTSETKSVDFLLNVVNKVVWSPNFHSRRWLLMAGNNGIVRAVHMKCLEAPQKTKKS